MDRIVTLEQVRGHPRVSSYLDRGNAHLGVLGFTEHGPRHAKLVASISGNILERLGYPRREQELASIAGYLHDIGNVVSRPFHAQIGAVLAGRLLDDVGMDPAEIAEIMGAIGNHEPEDGSEAVSAVSAAVILADKSDVHRTRVRNEDIHAFDVHDRVNYAATKSFLRVDESERAVILELEIDTEISPVMEYFEIFLVRMLACKRACEFLDTRFRLSVNGVRLL